METKFDILVMGGGHAGVEAANISCQFGLKVGLLSLKDVPLASAPCNPSIGGVGKGQVVREVDALGGLMGKIADLSAIQYRTLNESKGHAVRST
ncbi:MAG: FAD-dependent oxidoreductase, partial [Bacteriovoracales bacterium]